MAVFAAALGVTSRADQGTARERTQDGAGVYRVALELRYHGGLGSQYPVTDMTIPLPRLSADYSKGLGAFADVPAELRRMASQQAPAALHSIDASMLPPGMRVVPAAVMKDPAAHWIALSPVLHTREGLDALLFASAYCGGLCSEESYIWAHRDTTSSPWKLVRRLTSRVS